MNDPTRVTVQCAGHTDDGTRCERTMTVHVFWAKREHYCYDHSEGESR